MSIETYEALTARFDCTRNCRKVWMTWAGEERARWMSSAGAAKQKESSMNYFIDVAASAQRDLADAFDYIDLNLKNPSAADKLVAIAWKKFRSLDTFHSVFHL